MVEQPEQMVEVVGCGGAVAEDDDRLVLILFCEQEHVEVVFPMRHGDLDVRLAKGGWDGEDLGVDLTDKDGLTAGFARHILQCAYFRCDGSGEE
jgi:hypothetical protein